MTTSLVSERDAPPASELRGRYLFGSFEVDLDADVLTRDGNRIAVPPQPFRLLRYLLLSGGRIVTREELKQALWGDETFVDFDRGLNFCILQLRTALDDDAKQPAYIETVPRKGYRFIAPVVPSRPVSAAPIEPGTNIRRTVFITAAAIAVIAIVAWLIGARGTASPAHKIRLAVLPLENMSGERDNYLVDGLTEETITELSQIAPDRLAVVARTSVQQFRGSRKDVRTIAKLLGVDYVLEGSVRRQNERVRATFQLIRAADQTHIWSETYDRDAADILGLQTSLAQRVAGSLELKLAPRAQKPHDSRAFDEYLRGRTLTAQRKTADLEAGAQHLERAVTIEPGFASAQIALAEAWHLLQMRGKIPHGEAREKIRAAVDHALQSEPDLASAHAMAGILAFFYDWKFDVAERELIDALRRNPSDGAARHDYGWLLLARGRADEAIEQIRRGQELDPLSPRTNIDVAWAYIYTGRYDDAIREATRTAGTYPEFEGANHCLQKAHEMKGDVVPERSLHEKRLAEASDPYQVAAELAWLGRTDEAFRSLERCFETRNPSLPFAAADPMLTSLRSDPRFPELIRKIGIR